MPRQHHFLAVVPDENVKYSPCLWSLTQQKLLAHQQNWLLWLVALQLADIEGVVQLAQCHPVRGC